MISRNSEVKVLRAAYTNSIEFEFADEMEICLGGKANSSKVVVATRALSGTRAAKKSSDYFGHSNSNSNSNAFASDEDDDENLVLDIDSNDAKNLRAKKAAKAVKANPLNAFKYTSKPLEELDTDSSKFSR